MTLYKDLNFIDSRNEKIESLRQEGNEIGLEKAINERCSKSFRGDGYTCPYIHGFANSEFVHYNGELGFSFRLTPKEMRIDRDYLNDAMASGEIWDIMKCAKDKLNILPEFGQCKSVFLSHTPERLYRRRSKALLKKYPDLERGYHTVVDTATYYFNEFCRSSDDIRNSLTPAHRRARDRWIVAENDHKIKELKSELPTADDETKESINERISIFGRIKNEAKERLKNKNTYEDLWNKVQANSLRKGFLFNSTGIITPIGDRYVSELNADGVILSPIHEFVADEVKTLRKAASEAFYVCTPPEGRTVKRRRLKMFKP